MKIEGFPQLLFDNTIIQFVEDHTHPGITFSDGYVVVDSLLIVALIVGFCNCSIFCCALQFVEDHTHLGISFSSNGKWHTRIESNAL